MMTHNYYRGRLFWSLPLEGKSEVGIELEGSRTHVTAIQNDNKRNDVYVGHDFKPEYTVKKDGYSWVTIKQVYDAMLALEEADTNAANT